MLNLDKLREKLDLTLKAETAESYKTWYTQNRLNNYLGQLESEKLEEMQIKTDNNNELMASYLKNDYLYNEQIPCLDSMVVHLAAA